MASGDTLLVFHATGAASALTTDATFDERNNQICLDFDASAKETARFTGVMPRNYGGGGIAIRAHLAMSTATSGNIDWDTELERQTGLDLDTDSFAAAQVVDATNVPTTAGEEFVLETTHTSGGQMDSVVAGDQFRLRVARDSPNDDAAGDAELYTIEIKES